MSANCECGVLQEAAQAIPTAPADRIRWIQDSLNRVIGAGLAVDGVLSSRTRAAVRRFQQLNGLAPDGVPGSRTRSALASARGSGTTPARAAPRPASPATPGVQACPRRGQMAVDRCTRPGTRACPAIPDLLCLRDVDGMAFDYVEAVQRDTATGLNVVDRRLPRHTQRFVPGVHSALRGFIDRMRRAAMSIEGLLTAGSHYCRCISGTDTLSNHSFGDAIDVVGVRWPPSGGPTSRLRETIVHNWTDPGERALLRRMNACLRLSFVTVIDYNYNADHRDHFHCDMNRGQGRNPWGRTTMVFAREALETALGRPISRGGESRQQIVEGLRDTVGFDPARAGDSASVNAALDRLFERVAAGA